MLLSFNYFFFFFLHQCLFLFGLNLFWLNQEFFYNCRHLADYNFILLGCSLSVESMKVSEWDGRWRKKPRENPLHVAYKIDFSFWGIDLECHFGNSLFILFRRFLNVDFKIVVKASNFFEIPWGEIGKIRPCHQ